ncbi:head-tail connector protein [Melaminivora sp.]|uniref:head-tail connector protein n=1 Tax=Melaminivora sp. TaxID=1933032 RepID=UPI0028AD2E64|nr:head-tail connector protein [Melaminivora sp.]
MPAPQIVTLEQAKAHLRIDGTDADDDIRLKLSAATQIATTYLDRAVYATQQELDAAVLAGTAGIDPLVATDMVRAGILLILGDLDANREDVVAGTIATRLPTGARACLLPLRRMGA